MDAPKASYSITLMASVLGVTRAGYYAWKSRAPQRGERALVRRRLDEAVAWEHEVSGGTYGAPRIRHALARSGVDVGVRARRVDAPPGPDRPEHAPTTGQARRAGPCGP